MQNEKKQPKISRKKFLTILGGVAVLPVGGWAYANYTADRPENIFEEILKDLINNGKYLEKNPNIQFHGYNALSGNSDLVQYYEKSSLPENFYDISIDYYYNLDLSGYDVIFKYRENMSDDYLIAITDNYMHETQTLESMISLFNGTGRDRRFEIDDVEQISQYLKSLGITREQLENIHEEGLNNFFLTGWTSVYKSSFSPEDYGNVNVVYDWDKYFTN